MAKPSYNGTVTHNQFFNNVGGNGIVDLANNILRIAQTLQF